MQAKKKSRCVIRGDGVVYESVSSAAREMGLSANAIYAACSGAHRTAGGHEWSYAGEDGLPLDAEKTVKLEYGTPEQAALIKSILAYEATVRMTTPEIACLQLLVQAADVDKYPEQIKAMYVQMNEKVRQRALALAAIQLKER